MSNSRWVHERSEEGVWSSRRTATLALKMHMTLQFSNLNYNIINNLEASKHYCVEVVVSFLLARMLCIVDSMSICKAEVSLQMSCLLRLDKFNPVFGNSSCVCSSCGNVIFIPKQPVQLWPESFFPEDTAEFRKSNLNNIKEARKPKVSSWKRQSTYHALKSSSMHWSSSPRPTGTRRFPPKRNIN